MKNRILDTGINTPDKNMAIDAELLENLSAEPETILHLYEWSAPSATYGHFVQPFDFLDEANVAKSTLQLARRPTGGGIIFHEFDFAFSVLVPASHPKFSINTLENYALINQMVMQAVIKFMGRADSPMLLPEESMPLDESCKHFCMAKPTKFDVMINGRKVGGGAQRRTKAGILHHGSIALVVPSECYMKSLLKPGTRIYEAMASHSFPLLSGLVSPTQLSEARNALRTSLIDSSKNCSKMLRIELQSIAALAK